MPTIIENMSPTEFKGLVAIAGGLAVGAIAIVAGVWSKIRHAEIHARQQELETELKHEMVARGMSADEIDRVLKTSAAKPPKDAKCC